MTIGIDTLWTKGVDLIPIEIGKIVTEVILVCLRDLGAKTQNGVYSPANYINGSFGSNFVSASVQASFRTVIQQGFTRMVMIVLSNTEVICKYAQQYEPAGIR
jgi:hypothetical protein